MLFERAQNHLTDALALTIGFGLNLLNKPTVALFVINGQLHRSSPFNIDTDMQSPLANHDDSIEAANGLRDPVADLSEYARPEAGSGSLS